jgi:hypothetical protein
VEETDLMSSSCCWEVVVGATGVGVTGAADVDGIGAVEGLVLVVLAVVSFCFVGVAVLESSSLSESESESQVRSSFVVCVAPVLACC